MVSRNRQDQLIGILLRYDGWVTAAELADRLGVTPRSVRTYISQINARSGEGTAISSGPAGYHPNHSLLAEARPERTAGEPNQRLHRLARALLHSTPGVDIRSTAVSMHVSEATIESDVVRLRNLLDGTALRLERAGTRMVLSGEELAKRRLVSQLAHEEMIHGALNAEALRRAAGLEHVDPDAFAAFREELVSRLAAAGYYVNELGSADVLLHVAIAVDRVRQGRVLRSGADADRPASQARLAEMIAELTVHHFGVELGTGDAEHLAMLTLTRIVAPAGEAQAGAEVGPGIAEAVRTAVEHASAEYLVDLAQPDFLQRLSLHVHNLVQRARDHAWVRNPLTHSVKSAYPMVFQVAVAIASDIARALEITIHDDEIAYIAMHVGGRIEASNRTGTVLTATILCPGYYELHELLRSRVDRSLGSSIEVVRVETRTDPDFSSIDTDLILTTIAPPEPDERTVVLPPFVSEADMERISAVAARRRRSKRLTRLRSQLAQYLSEDAFLRPLPASGEEATIRRLAEPLLERGVIEQSYVEQTIDRERLSSTAFTDALAVPHALHMSASRTAISIGVAENSVPWGENRVQVVALVAFSDSDRQAFQTIFEQLVEVFHERDSVQRILRRGTDFPRFLDELVAVIDG
ncbi:MAG TPA: PTS sugar transporter subunit IIA [Candidatus Nesterenkonia stercoripullorum]|uniref:PTS sugar transporter subunit IIA n=1 Tax=Candidatus Nesterenkonia stercoripullorum TaxID=2838701 RepID=A0A9D1S2N8_9MICC|nr:PTS sugar transporter subunit IIA [Candidatus Nesterenkonia stercoripullorum]